MKQLMMTTILLMCTSISYSDTLTASESDPIQQAIIQCESCHSAEHNHSAEPNTIAPVLDGMDDDYIEQQLINFQTGKRIGKGANAADVEKAHSHAVVSGDSLSLIADHYDELEYRISQIALPPTTETTSEQGEELFDDQCASCHTSAFGRFLSDGPEITHLEAPYVLEQLQRMKTGQRGFHEETKHHRKMVERLKAMSTEDLVNIVTYIHQNAESF